MPAIAWIPIWAAVKGFGAKAGAAVIGSRALQIALAVAVALIGIGLFWGHYKGLKEDLALAGARLTICQQASASQVGTINRLRDANRANAEQYADALSLARARAEEINRLESAIRERNDDQIRQVVESAQGNDCAGEPMPDDLRLRLRP